MPCCTSLWRKMWRRKTYTSQELEATELKRCISMWELTLYGIGQTIGSGIYVLSGTVVRSHAGPAAPVSYLLGGLISLMSALCYAEFSTIIPRAGSSYSYTYFTIGEWVAYIIGWDLMLEHSMIAAGTSRALVRSLDILLHDSIRNWTLTNVGKMEVPGFSESPEFLAGVVVLLVAGIVMLGAKQSVLTTAFLAGINILISVLVVVAGMRHADISNWTNKDHGGFAPFGFSGILGATAIVFTAYSGYDAICTAAEESKNPSQTLPRAIASTMTLTICLYVLLTSTLTLASPYYKVDPEAAFTKLFTDMGEMWAADFVTATIMLAAFAVSLCNMFAVSRIAFAMARDGVLFRCFGYVNKKTGTPMLAVLTFAVCTALLATLFDVEQLAEVISVGTLMAATIVPLCVLVLRYRAHIDELGDVSGCELKVAFHSNSYLKRLTPHRTIVLTITFMTSAMIVTSVMIRCVTRYDVGDVGAVICWTVAGLMAVAVLVGLLLLTVFQQNQMASSFRVPLVPLFPAVSVFLNIICLGQISDMGWLRYAAWMLVGTLIYFGYGVWNSAPEEDSDGERSPLTEENNMYHSNGST